jgi:hypothetical protein
MQTATYEMAIEAARLLFSSMRIAVAAVVWLLLASGIVGRVVQHLEELPHLRAVQTRLGYSHPPVAAAERASAAGS